MKEPIFKEFNYKLESDARLDIYSSIGEESVNSDNFEVLTNKNLTVLILASGEGEANISNIVSEMAASQALELLDKHDFNKKSSAEILEFLKEAILNINNIIVEYLEVADIQGCSASLSLALIYKNSFFTAHIGKNRIYVIHKDDTPTLLSKDPSYSKRISTATLSKEENSNYLGDKELNETNIFVKEEANLSHKETIFISTPYMTEYLSENKFIRPIEEIEELLTSYPPLKNASFLRYLHYERSVEVIRIEKEEIDSFNYDAGMLDFNIDWQTLLPLLKKVTLVLGIILIIVFLYGLIEKLPNETLKEPESNRVKNLVLVEENNSIPTIKKETSPKAPIEVPPINHIPKPIVPKKTEEIKIETQEIKEQEIKTQNIKHSTALKFLKKADSEVLYVEDMLRITFKENQLIASKVESFYEKNGNSQKLYCKINSKNAELNGEIVQLLEKQDFASSVRINHNRGGLLLSITIKEWCSYTRSQWAKKSGLDLLTFSCD